ncbi:hypothetical protein LP419_39005 [Massilia sp. H-1]|nr:hypothetical protein LP419_39005 [Massilia sp. H-1]
MLRLRRHAGRQSHRQQGYDANQPSEKFVRHVCGFLFYLMLVFSSGLLPIPKLKNVIVSPE